MEHLAGIRLRGVQFLAFNLLTRKSRVAYGSDMSDGLLVGSLMVDRMQLAYTREARLFT